MKKILYLTLFVSIIFLISACGDETTKTIETNESGGSSEEVLTWVTGSDGGGWYSTAGGIASLVNDQSSNIDLKVIPGGALQNIPFISNGEAQIAWGQAPFLTAGVSGEDPFDEVYDDQLAIGSGFSPVYFHFAVGADTNIKSFDQIFEEEVPINIGVTPVNNSEELIFRKIMEFYDVTYDDIESWGGKIFHGSISEQANEFQNHNIDFMFAQLGLPGSTITEVSNDRDLRLIPLSDELLDYLSDYYVLEGTIPKGMYPKIENNDEEIKTGILDTILLAEKNVSDDVVYEITQIINDNEEQLSNIHASLESYSTQNAVSNLPVDIHPGAERYYKEMGIIE